MNNQIKQLTGKNKQEYEQVAKHLVDNCDIELYKELVEQENYLFDFIKQNVAERIFNACNETNYKNLLAFFKYYSPSYDDAIIAALAKYADEDLTDEILDLFETGNEDEKCYCAKYFSYIQDSLAIDLLRENSYTENESLNANCAATLGILKDTDSYEKALSKLDSDDEFERLAAVKFLVIYGNQSALDKLINIMKTSSLAENIAGYIPYLMDIPEILNKNYENGLLVLNNITNGLGEILSLYEVINFRLYDIYEDLIYNPINSQAAVVLLNAQDKFNTLTENDEYIFDEDKNTQTEIKEIHKLLSKVNTKQMKSLILNEIREDSPFVFTALDYTDNAEEVQKLLRCNDQTLILKTAEVLKKLGTFDNTAKTVALLKITDDNIKSVIRAL